ncbi:ATP-binding protein [Bacillus sp. T3]|uniref:sensor histidine kinase n=1 Tax=Bacillus sp. T3 TaxID=467262 RepID=UPI002981D4A6|nr:ATP-binding protein [Bacillus sp. T3]
MQELTEQLLLLAGRDEQWKVELKEVNIAQIATELVRSFQNAYHRKINLQIEDDGFVIVDPQKFKQLFYILMDNAQKYSEESIDVVIRREQKKVSVEICDRGIGIPTDQLDKIFDRFYRVDQARARKTGGFGLGLSLAKEIAEVIGAELQIESTEGIGTKVKIMLFTANPH